MKITKVNLPSNKKFGAFFTLIFLLGSIYFYIKDEKIVLYFFSCLSLILLIITFTKSEMLLPLNKLWMKFGLVLGMIMGPIILGVIFFIIFVPIGILFRLIGRDELCLNFKNKLSYWQIREASMRKEPFRNQF
ncbi:SxtJ family membrane protein [Candidatus Pelagibacter sp.]|nr:SxtJ family membrane protein [Candidatus Pelagibacter sp.]